MNIDPLSNSEFLRPTPANGHKNDPAGQRHATGGGSDQLHAAFSSRVREALASIPEVRPEVVERGRQLLADPAYPSFEIATEIARRITPLSEEWSADSD